MELFCSQCANPLNRMPSQVARSKSGRVFCSRTCATRFNNREYKSWSNHPNFKTGKHEYRKRAFARYGKKCMNKDCPFGVIEIHEKMLDVDHIDSNRSNGSVINLQVLCVWCHAQKTRLKNNLRMAQR